MRGEGAQCAKEEWYAVHRPGCVDVAARTCSARKAAEPISTLGGAAPAETPTEVLAPSSRCFPYITSLCHLQVELVHRWRARQGDNRAHRGIHIPPTKLLRIEIRGDCAVGPLSYVPLLMDVPSNNFERPE